ncbi:MAG: hypothetical protein GY719_15705 [bacterium]|nr:hypothetical protein [bacterium]
MRIALTDLRLDRIDVIHAREETFTLAEDVRAVGLGQAWGDLEPLSGKGHLT